MLKTNSAKAFIALSLYLTCSLAAAAAADSSKAAAPAVAARDSTTKIAPAKDTIKTVASVKDTSKPAAAPIAIADSAKAAIPASSAPLVAASDSAVSDSAAADSAKAGRAKKRKRIVRETTVNSIDELKGRYRSPKKALFMSLLVPGLGQAYVGQNWFNYTRGAVYFLADVALAYGWHYYVVDRQDAQIAKYRKFADQNWSQTRYENGIESQLTTPFDNEKFGVVNPHRQSYCEAVQNRDTNKGNTLFSGCTEPNGPDYQGFKSEYNDASWGGTDSISARRAQFPDPHQFYELIGKEVEFIQGWTGSDNVVLRDSTFYLQNANGDILTDASGKPLPATTASQQQYIQMRAQANDYARMQAYFLGGMVINHIVSALDAALTAHYHNKSLYQTEARWWDSIHLESGLAWQGYQPTTSVTARVTF